MDDDYKLLLFQSITKGNQKVVEQVLDAHKGLTFIYNDDGKSAAAVAIESKKFKVYDILVQHDLFLDSEEFKAIVPKLLEREKIIMREIHLRNSKSIYEMNYLATLLKRSKVAYNNLLSERVDFYTAMVEAFNELNNVEVIKPLLKLVANAEITIQFDFYKDNVENVDPTQDSNTEGNTYASVGRINIGASLLLESSKQARAQVWGTLAHELCHYAVELYYNNDCNPFFNRTSYTEMANGKRFRPGSDLEDEFEQIFNDCKSKQHLEVLINAENSLINVEKPFIKVAKPLINVVFIYPEPRQRAELIVRVPHILLHYKYDEEKLALYEDNFAGLFEFYRTRTFEAFDELCPLTQLNEILNYSPLLNQHEVLLKPEALPCNLQPTKAYILQSNFPALTASAIHQKFKHNSRYLFSKLASFKDDTMVKTTLKNLQEVPNSFLVVDCSKENKVTVEKAFDKMKSSRIIFTTVIGSWAVPQNLLNTVLHSWKNLTTRTQNKLLTFDIEFRGNNIKLQDLLSKDSEDLLNGIILEDLIYGRLKVASKISWALNSGSHVERKFTNNASSFPFDGEKLMSLSKNQPILLSSAPGAGKSTEFQLMAEAINKKFPTLWVEFIDLKKFVKAYERDGKVSQPFDDQSAIINYLSSKKMLNMQKFEKEVFIHLFNNNRVVLFLDGFDEISPDFKQFNKTLIEGLTSQKLNLKNSLWVSTRPHLELELSRIMGNQIYRLAPMTFKDREKYFVGVMENLDFSDELISEKLKNIQDFFFNKIEVHSNTISSPMLIKMVADLLEVNPMIDFSQENIYSIYKSFQESVRMNCMDRGDLARAEFVRDQDRKMEVVAFHLKKALEVIFLLSFPDLVAELQSKIDECFTCHLSVDQMFRVGFLTVDDFGVLGFVHRSYAEYFTAEFFHRFVFDPDETNKSALILFKYCWVGNNANFRVTRRFIDAFLEKQNQTLRTRAAKIFYSSFSEPELKEIFQLLVNERLITLIQVFTELPCRKSLWDQKFQSNVNIFLSASKWFSVKEIEVIFNLATDEKVFDEKEIADRLKEVSYHGYNCIFNSVVNWNSGVFEFLLNSKLVPLTLAERKEQIMALDNYGRSAIIYALQEGQFEKIESIMTSLKLFTEAERIKILTAATDRRNILHHAVSISRMENLKALFEHMKALLPSPELKMLFFVRNTDKQTPLAKCLSCKDVDMIEAFWNFFKEILTSEVKRNLDLELPDLYLVIIRRNEAIFKTIRNYVENLFGKEYLKHMLMADQRLLMQIKVIEKIQKIKLLD